MADKIKKNLLGRDVTVQRKTMSDGSLAKTRTVTSKSGGTISSKTSYKDAGSVAGKMRVNKIKKAAMEGAKEGMAKPVAKQSNRIDNKIERLENRKQRIGSDKGMNKRQFERASDIRKKIYDLNKKRNAS